MPKIKITEIDNTGVAPTGEETVVFVPDPNAATNNVKGLDANGCLLIGVEDKLPEELVDKAIGSYIANLQNAGLQTLYSKANISKAEELKFLLDKNEYNVKFLTAGAGANSGFFPSDINAMFTSQSSGTFVEKTKYYSITETSIKFESSISQDNFEENKTNLYTFNGVDSFNNMLDIAVQRGDCVVIGGIDTSAAPMEKWKSFFTTVLPTTVTANGVVLGDEYKRCALFCSGSKIEGESVETIPELQYLIKYGEAEQEGNKWLSIANYRRALLDTSSIATISKYQLDENILTKEGRSFNGIINLRPYGRVIWGDRTLLNNEGSLKASSFLSTRMMICDLAKRVYTSAINCTYETNDDITWTFFKGRITDLLDQMVAGRVLSYYEVLKQPTEERQKIKCQIHLVPFAPVEDFDITILLTDAETEITVVGD